MEWMRKDFSSSFWSALLRVTQWMVVCRGRGMKSWLGKVFPKNYQIFAQILSRSPIILPVFCYHVFFPTNLNYFFFSHNKIQISSNIPRKGDRYFFHFFFSSSGIFTRFLGNVGNTKKNYFTIFLFFSAKRKIIQWETRERNEITTFDDLVTNKTERIFTKKLRKKRLRAREASSFGYIRRVYTMGGEIGWLYISRSAMVLVQITASSRKWGTRSSNFVLRSALSLFSTRRAHVLVTYAVYAQHISTTRDWWRWLWWFFGVYFGVYCMLINFVSIFFQCFSFLEITSNIMETSFFFIDDDDDDVRL